MTTNPRDLGRRFDRIRSDLAAIEGATMPPTRPPSPEPEPDPPPRPEPEPVPPRPPRPRPTSSVVTSEVWNESGAREFVALSPATAGPWIEYPDNAGEYCEKHVRLGDAHLWVWWERTPGGTWPTVLLTPRKGAGAQRWSRVRFQVGGQAFYDQRVDNAALLPMQAHLKSMRPTDASGWDFIEDARPFPDWSEGAMRVDTANRSNHTFMGRRFFWGEGSASSAIPQEPGAPAGPGVGFYSSGKDDAFCGPAAKSNRWAECVGEFWKGIWRLDEAGDPELVDGPYWSGRDYAQNPVRGYEWSWGDANSPLGQHGRPADGPHFRRIFRAPAALARWSAPARLMLRMAWKDVESAWNLDGPEHPNDLLTGFQHLLADPPRWPQPTGLRGSRYFAHAVGCLVEAWEWIDTATRERYAEAFAQWYLAISDANGMANRDRSGDAAYHADKAGIEGYPTSAFQSALIVANVQRLAALATSSTVQPARDLEQCLGSARAFLAGGPWAYCWRSEDSPQRGETWSDRFHSAREGLTTAQKSWSPDGGTYATAAANEWVAWADAEAMDARARQIGVNGDTPYDLLPRSAWEGLWR
ncbi:MAG TPA: hypothetical protein VM285_02275 [Polyangia bacterium]|nr:hypothetical protein [Polyangia bacterium]